MNDLFSIAGSAEKLAISPWTIRAHLKRGTIRSVRVGRRVLIPRKELERLATEGLPSLSGQMLSERLSSRRNS